MGKVMSFVKKKQKNAMMYGFDSVLKKDYAKTLDKYGKKGVEALKKATPRATGKTAESWIYEVKKTENGFKILWYNTNENKGENIAILIEYGHGTRNGGYVKGRPYINKALTPVFEEMVNEIWKEVTTTV